MKKYFLFFSLVLFASCRTYILNFESDCRCSSLVLVFKKRDDNFNRVYEERLLEPFIRITGFCKSANSYIEGTAIVSNSYDENIGIGYTILHAKDRGKGLEVIDTIGVTDENSRLDFSIKKSRRDSYLLATREDDEYYTAIVLKTRKKHWVKKN